MDYKARAYDPLIGRFISPDSIVPGTSPQSLNRYSYVNNDPVAATDPSGHVPCSNKIIRDDQIICTGGSSGGSGNGGNDGSGSGNGNQGNGSSNSENAWDYITNCVESVGQCYSQGWTNFGSAWSTIINPNASALAKTYSGIYMFGWGGAHVAVVTGGIVILRQGVIAIGTYMATQNPNGINTVIGGFPEYKTFAQANGYTYFDLGRWYNTLEAFGLAKPINSQFVASQIDQAKNFLQVSPGGAGTVSEVAQILSSRLYTQIATGWSTFTSIFTYTPPPLP